MDNDAYKNSFEYLVEKKICFVYNVPIEILGKIVSYCTDRGRITDTLLIPRIIFLDPEYTFAYRLFKSIHKFHHNQDCGHYGTEDEYLHRDIMENLIHVELGFIVRYLRKNRRFRTARLTGGTPH